VLEAFEAAILNFPVPLLVILHDRWFMQRFGGTIWELTDSILWKRWSDLIPLAKASTEKTHSLK
jgi:macrolide transport system ATP-binding/permease protein